MKGGGEECPQTKMAGVLRLVVSRYFCYLILVGCLKEVQRMTFRQDLAVAFRSLFGYRSYSAAGEDRLVMAWLRVVARTKLPDVRYCDIGANHPKYLSNTFALYQAGASGVLIEPDPFLCGKLRRARPRDAVLNVGAAFDDRRAAKLQRFSHRAFNTFLPAQADMVVKSSEQWRRADRQRVVDEIEVPLVPANDILAANFAQGIDFLSIDTEGCNLQILESIDLERFRPKIICIEASDDFDAIMRASYYELIARTPDNVIYQAGAR
jgi:FkbM family methyltransferase